MEAHRLRVKDLVLERCEVIVRDAKGGRDRVTVLPTALVRKYPHAATPDVRTTMLYNHAMGKGAMGVKSPLAR